MSTTLEPTSEPPPTPVDERLARVSFLAKLLQRPELGAIIGAVVVMVFFWVTTDAFGTLKQATENLAQARASFSERTARQDLAQFQLGELEKAGITPGEDDELAATRRILANAEFARHRCIGASRKCEA